MEDDWVTTHGGTDISLEWLQCVFPNKDISKLRQWMNILQQNDFENVDELKLLTDSDWDKLNLPLACVLTIKNVLRNGDTTLPSPLTTSEPLPPVSQIDIVVLDISFSMQARSTIDVDKTREDVSKMLFHTLVDKLISLELFHAVGLLAFGNKVTPINITREYERFHDELGRLDANEGGTKLYDAIAHAADMIGAYACDHSSDILLSVKHRIFALTDGEDNSSSQQAYQVARMLQDRGIVLDAIPVAGANRVLHAMCVASGGKCFKAVSQEQAMELFEREATLHIAYRDASPCNVEIVDAESLNSLVNSELEDTVSISSAVPKVVYAPVMSQETINTTRQVGTGSVKRILREYDDLQRNAVHGWRAFIGADDVHNWKATLVSQHPPYECGTWLLTIQFPRDYPFKPPKVRFVTPIYHCNISADGGLCLDILKDSWNPALTISKVFLSISALLSEPNPFDPLDAYKGQLYRDNKELYLSEARKHTAIHATATFDALAEKYSLL